MQFEINNPLNTRNKRIGGIVVAFLTIGLLFVSSGGGSGDITESRELITEASSEIGNASYGDYDPVPVENRLERARSKLDNAEESGGDSEQIEYLRTYANVIGHLSDAMSGLSQAGNKFEAAQSYMDSSRYDDALNEVQEAENHIQESKSSIDKLESGTAELQSYDYESDQLALADMRHHAQEMKSSVQPLEGVTSGYRKFIKGMKDYMSATDYADNEEYAQASSYYINAQQHFSEAESDFRQTENSTTGDLKASAIELSCLSENMKDLSQKYSEFYQAVMEEDQEEYQRLQSEIEDLQNRSCGEE